MNYISVILALCLWFAGCGGASVAIRSAARSAAKAAKIANKVPESPKPKVIKPEAETGNHNAGKVVIDVGAEMAHEPLNDDSVPLDD